MLSPLLLRLSFLISRHYCIVLHQDFTMYRLLATAGLVSTVLGAAVERPVGVQDVLCIVVMDYLC